MPPATSLPFEVPFSQVISDPEPFVSAVFASLESEFLVMPKGAGFLEFSEFQHGYERLKQATQGFKRFDTEKILAILPESPVSLIVLRSILGLSPPEWAYLASRRSGLDIQQGFARAIDRDVRLNPSGPFSLSSVSEPRVRALIATACELILQGPPPSQPSEIHRLSKADTQGGSASVRSAASIGLPYAMVLYERFLGRTFASHRDSVSELIGDRLEIAIEETLSRAGVSYRKTRRAEKIPGFDQAPDFVVPSEFDPKVVIEAKITEDDGTARDKVTRIQHLAELASTGTESGQPRFELIACIGGRGFGVRREDMRKLLLATRGKVYTPMTLSRMIDTTSLKAFRSA
jgi:hypothetical protein